MPPQYIRPNYAATKQLHLWFCYYEISPVSVKPTVFHYILVEVNEAYKNNDITEKEAMDSIHKAFKLRLS